MSVQDFDIPTLIIGLDMGESNLAYSAHVIDVGNFRDDVSYF